MQDYRLTVLRKKGYRVTLPRQEILNALTTFPQSAKEIFEKVNKKNASTTDLVTVYRTLEFFCTEGLVTKLQFNDNTAKYEFNSSDNHHHHLICEKCGMIKDISVDDAAFLNNITTKSKFTVRRHTLELWGLCPKCTV